ncbi:hypothetical protein [Bradyrhizobium sp. CCBAU 25360]|uniref:hypothetical protein n=1 Tax=Bradyrhizobium sp. CCBAU 25360 TaxID=858425 RepID=UPI0023062C99|nr:hypothetical protein [Bradyrhizobium sp. CCBAU 25360]
MICGLIATTLPFGRSAAPQEPATLGSAAPFVGLALLQGAISYVGGRLSASALGDPVISDVQSWFKNAIAELEAFVSAELRRQLDQRAMEQMRADLPGINTNLCQYSSLRASNRPRNKYLLERCDMTTASLLPLSLYYDQALFVTTIATYRLFTPPRIFRLSGASPRAQQGPLAATCFWRWLIRQHFPRACAQGTQ